MATKRQTTPSSTVAGASNGTPMDIASRSGVATCTMSSGVNGCNSSSSGAPMSGRSRRKGRRRVWILFPHVYRESPDGIDERTLMLQYDPERAGSLGHEITHEALYGRRININPFYNQHIIGPT